MKKLFLTLASIFIFSSIAFCSNIEEAYIFDVGQGNCQFFRYGNVGILYDGGSSTSRTFSKVKPLKREDFELFIAKKTKNEIFLLEDIEVDLSQFNKSFSGLKELPKQFTDTKKVKKGKKIKIVKNVDEQEMEDDKERIINVLENANLEYLFLFLSHPDEDHINYIEDILSNEIFEKIKLISFLGGDWLNHDTEDSIRLISFLNKRDQGKTATFYPYYWDFIKGNPIESEKYLIPFYGKLAFEYLNKTTPNYDEEIQKIKNQYKEKQDRENAIKDYKKSLGIEHRTDLIKNLKKDYKFPDLNSGSYLHMNTFCGSLSDLLSKLGLTIKSLDLLQAMDSTYIWSLNYYAKDINEQSIVISCTLPSLEMNFFCTGDAGESTFNSIAMYYNLMKNYNFLNINPTNNDFLNVLIIPHHGSINNQSLTMLELFNPHILISSAGYGTYDHPDKYIHDFYQDRLPLAYKELQKRFLLDEAKEDEIIFFDKKEERAYLKRYSQGEPLMLCTNICGDIKFDLKGIARKYFPYLMLGNTYYKPDISQSIFSTSNHSLDKSGLDFTNNENINWYKNKLYYYVSDVDKKDIWLYKLEEKK